MNLNLLVENAELRNLLSDEDDDRRGAILTIHLVQVELNPKIGQVCYIGFIQDGLIPMDIKLKF